MAQASLETIVQRMIDAGESEDNIAMVIKEYKPPVTNATAITAPVTNVDTTKTPETQTSPVIDQPPSRIEQLYRTMFEAPEFITKPVHELANYITEPSNEDESYFSGLKARAKGFVGGALEGAASLLSPANILTAGRGEIPALASRVLGGTQALHGIHELSKGNYGEGIGDIAFGALNIGTPSIHEPVIEKPSYTPLPADKDNVLAIRKAIEAPIVDTNRPEGVWDQNLDLQTKPAGLSEDQLFDLARNRQNMGQDHPVLGPLNPPERTGVDELLDVVNSGKDKVNKPTAEFLGMQPTADGGEIPLFNVKGGPKDKSTVTPNELRELGIDIPEVPKDAPRLSGEELRQISIKKRQAEMDARNKGFRGTVPDDMVSDSGTVDADIKPSTNIDQQPIAVDKRYRLKSELQENIPIRERTYSEDIKPSMASEIWNASRSAQSIDLPGITSAALRQSRPLSFTKDWFEAWGKALTAFRNKDEAYEAMKAATRENKYLQPQYEPIYNKKGELLRYNEKPSYAEESGLAITDLLNKREEAIGSSLVEKIPGYGRYAKASNRAYTAFLNDLRVNKFEQMIDGAKAAGIDIDKDLVRRQKVADFVNNATGRGSLKYAGGKVDLEPIKDLLGNTLYSPRALSARLAFINPANYVKSDPLTQKEYWKSLARIAVSWGAASGLASLMPGVKVSTDPTNADFGKIRIDNTRIDPGAGFQQLLVMGGRQAYGGITSSTSGKFTKYGKGPYSGGYIKTPASYLYNQLHPSLRMITDLLSTASQQTGQPFDLSDRTIQLILPMYITSIASAAAEDDTTAAFFSALLESAGMGVQSYEKGDINKPQVTPFIEKGLKGLTGQDVLMPTMKIGGKQR